MAERETLILTVDEAIAMLPDGESIHTFRASTPNMLVGCDWERQDLLDAIHKTDCLEIGGEMCCGMNHGLVVWTDDNPLFVECREGTDYEKAAREVAEDEREQRLDAWEPGHKPQ